MPFTITRRAIMGFSMLAIVGLIGPPATAQPATFTSGKIIAIFGDPGDFVVQLEMRGRCGSNFFHIQRAKANFKEMTAVALTAFASDKTMGFFVVSCGGDRNITSHGVVTR